MQTILTPAGTQASKGIEIIPEADFVALRERVFAELQKLPHPYHNRPHTEERVLPSCLEYAREANLFEEDTQLLAVGAIFHDKGHAGATYRQLVPGINRPDLSNEEFAGVEASAAVENWYGVEKRTSLKALIHATSFAQNQLDKLPPEHADILYRPYRPETQLEKLLAFADVSNFRWGLNNFIQDNLNVVAESGKGGIPENFEKFISTRIGFLGYVQQKLDDVKPFFSEPFASKLQGELDAIREALSQLGGSDSHGYARWSAEFKIVREDRLAQL
jgi:hypothetical protein